jgi:hypothetical protein
MEYYWSLDIDSGIFDFWMEANEKNFLIKAKTFYEDKKFDYGITSEETYKLYKEKYNHVKPSKKISN